MVKKTLLAGLLAALPLMQPVLAADDLQVQLNAQQRTMLQLQNEISKLTADVAVLRGELETLRYELSQSGQLQSTAAANTAAATTAADEAAPAAVPVQAAQPKTQQAQSVQTAAAQPAAASTAQSAAASTDAAPALKTADAAAKAAYDAAYAKVTANDFSGAVVDFTNYVNTYPDNTLTPNAWYWLGQVQYRQNNLDAARVSFLNVARFTQSTKRPDALYKLGLISRSKGDEEKAVRYFNLVVSTYPADTSANMARAELAKTTTQ